MTRAEYVAKHGVEAGGRSLKRSVASSLKSPSRFFRAFVSYLLQENLNFPAIS